MRVWTDGGTHLVAGDEGVEVHRPNEAPVLHVVGKALKRGFPPRDVLAIVERDPLRFWVGRGLDVKVVSLAEGTTVERTVDAHVLDAIGLGDGRVLACVARKGDRRASLLIVDGAEPDFAAPQLTLPSAPRIEWPGGIWDKGAQWPEDDGKEEDDDPDEGDEATELDALAVGTPQTSGATLFDEVTFAANEHGIAVACVYSGLVAALSADASRVDFVVRVPTQAGEGELFAARTAEGVLAVICIEGRHSAAVHVAPDGTVLGHRHQIGKELAWGMGPPVVQGDRAVVYEAGSSGGDRLHELKLPALLIGKTVELGERPTGRLSVAAGPAGEPFVLGIGGKAVLVKRGARGKLGGEALPKPVAPKTAPREVFEAVAPLARGAPSLALAKGERGVAWGGVVGEAITIDVPFTNQGGASRGIAIEVGGPAFQSGLVQPGRVRLGEVEVTLVEKGSMARAELPAVVLAAGFVLEGGDKRQGPRPEGPTQVARVELLGAKVGTGVLTVRIAPLGAAPGRGSVLQGKSITVR